MKQTDTSKMKRAYLVTPNRNPRRDDFWLLFSSVFENSDGSLSIPLDRLGVHGTLIIRDAKEDDAPVADEEPNP